MKLVTVKFNDNSSYSAFNLPADVASTADQKISAQFAAETADTLRGLSPEEEEKYLPKLLGVQVKAEQWPIVTRDYWANMSIPVPAEGLILNITIKEDGEPLILGDWIKWRFICKHSEVAKNKKSVEHGHRFYMIDVEELKKDQIGEFEIRNRTNKAFMSLQAESNLTKAKWVAEVLRKADEKIVGMSKDEIYMFLEKKKDEILAEIEPKEKTKFIDVVNDENLEQKSMLMEFLGRQVIEKSGNSYYYGESILGDERETILWFKNQANSRTILEMKEKLKAYA